MRRISICLLTCIICFNVKAQHFVGNIFELPVDSFEIKLIGKSNSIYRSQFGVRKYFLNLHTHSLDYFDFNKHQHVRLFDVGEGLINITTGIGVISPDTIAFLTFKGILAYDSLGNCVYEHLFKKPYEYHSQMQAINSPLLKLEQGYLFENNRKKSLIDVFEPNKKTIRPLTDKRTYEKVGMLYKGSYDYHANTIATIYQCSPDVHVYNLKNKTMKIKSAKSSFDNGFTLREGSDDANLLLHWVTNGSYEKIMHHPALNKWIVIYFHPQSYINESGDTNRLDMGRKKSLIILDADFNITKEYVVPGNFQCTMNIFYSTTGIIINAYQTKEQYESKFAYKYYHVTL